MSGFEYLRLCAFERFLSLIKIWTRALDNQNYTHFKNWYMLPTCLQKNCYTPANIVCFPTFQTFHPKWFINLLKFGFTFLWLLVMLRGHTNLLCSQNRSFSPWESLDTLFLLPRTLVSQGMSNSLDFIYLFLATLSLWDPRSVSRDWTWALGSENVQSWPLVSQEIPWTLGNGILRFSRKI